MRLLVERALDPFADGVVETDDVRAAGDALVSVGLAELELVDELAADLTLALALRQPQVRLLPAVVRPAPAPMSGATPGSRAVATGPAPVGGDSGLVVTALSFGIDGATIHFRGQSDQGPDLFDGGPGGLPHLRGGGPSAGGARSRGPSSGPRPPRRRAGEGADPAPPMRLGDRPGPRHRPAGTERLFVAADDGQEFVLNRWGRAVSAPEQDGPRRWSWSGGLNDLPATGTGFLSVRSDPTRAAPEAGLQVHAPLPTVAARPHGRTPGAWWVLERLWSATAAFARTSRPLEARTLRAGITALMALDAIDPADPLVHQAGLLAAAVTPGGVDPALDRRWASPLERRDQPARPGTDVVRPVATTIDLGDLVVRLDALAVDEQGAELVGAVDRWSWAPPRPVAISAFDDRHNWYTVNPRDAGSAGGGPVEIVWDVWPALDPAASTLRLIVTGPEREASVEVGLR